MMVSSRSSSPSTLAPAGSPLPLSLLKKPRGTGVPPVNPWEIAWARRPCHSLQQSALGEGSGGRAEGHGDIPTRFRSHLMLACLLFVPTILSAAETYSVTVSTGLHERSLFEFTLPEGAPDDVDWELVDEAGQIVSMTQPALGNRRQRLGRLGQVPAGETRQLTLRPVPADRDEPRPPVIRGPHLTENDGQLRLLNSPHEILTYHTGPSQPPAGIAAHFARSGHIHPLKTPIGQTITAEFPADHAHQHGVFFAWVNTQFAGHKVDFWNQGEKLGNVRHRRLVESQAGKVYAGFISELEHLDLTGDVEQVVLQETWRVMACEMGDKFGEMYLVDLESKQTAASDEPLQVLKYHYGGFGWRGPSEWLSPKGNTPATGCQFLTSEGHSREQGNHTRPQWVSVTGSVNGELCTIAIFGHSTNLRHPQPVRLHPDKPYFCFAPCVLGDFAITRNEPLISRYRIMTHHGAAIPERYDGLVKEWAEPVKVSVTSKDDKSEELTSPASPP